MKKLTLFSLASILLTWDAFSLPPSSGKADAGTSVPLKNPGFEGTYGELTAPAENAVAQIKGALAESWNDNSDWADVAVDYAADATEPHGGETSQKVTVTRVSKGVVQLKQPVNFAAGHEYSFSVWLRGDSSSKVSLALRQATEPYNTYMETPVALTPDWQEYSVIGVVPDDTKGFLMIIVHGPVTFSVDDARLEEAVAAPR